MEENHMIQLPMNNLGRVIYYREKYGISQAKVAAIMDMTYQGWSANERKYKASYNSAQKAMCADLEGRIAGTTGSLSMDDMKPYLEMVRDYPFTPKQIHALNILLRPPLEDALVDINYPIVPDEHKTLMDALRVACYKDSPLTLDVLACISEASEENLRILRQTVDILIGIDDIYSNTNAVEKSAVLSSAIRNHVTNTIRQVVPNDECLEKFVEHYLPIAEEKVAEKLAQKPNRKEDSTSQKKQRYANLLKFELENILSQNLYERVEASIRKIIGRAVKDLVDGLKL